MKFVDEVSLANKRVFLRADLNVPLDESLNITDDHRIKSAIPTINYIKEQGGKLILASHLGRPKGKSDSKLSLKPVADRLQSLTGCEVKLATDCIGSEVDQLIESASDGTIVLLENVRFHKEEKENKPEFSKALANSADVFINDAFGTAHRAHSSTVGVCDFIPVKAGGFTLKKEIEYFSRCFENPARPLVAIFGGAKVSSKIGAINNVASRADKILVGGAMANTFFAARGINLGKSLFEEEQIQAAIETEKKLAESGCELLLPLDFAVAKEFSNDSPKRICKVDELSADEMALDIGPDTVALYRAAIAEAKTAIWNGPMGVLEFEEFAQGTYEIVRALSDSSALSVVGGGDTDLALHKLNAYSQMDYVSTGGGAFLTLLEGKDLPAVTALA